MLKLQELMESHHTFVFDLDRTVWDTYSKHGNPIWAKQILSPYDWTSTSDKVVDDCLSTCELHPGARDVLQTLSAARKHVGFLSRGGILGVPYEEQPSIRLLKHFGVYEYFNYEKLLLHKTDDKGIALQKIVDDKGSCVFFDDMQKDLDAAAAVKGVTPINRLIFAKWEEIL